MFATPWFLWLLPLAGLPWFFPRIRNSEVVDWAAFRFINPAIRSRKLRSARTKALRTTALVATILLAAGPKPEDTNNAASGTPFGLESIILLIDDSASCRDYANVTVGQVLNSLAAEFPETTSEIYVTTPGRLRSADRSSTLLPAVSATSDTTLLAVPVLDEPFGRNKTAKLGTTVDSGPVELTDALDALTHRIRAGNLKPVDFADRVIVVSDSQSCSWPPDAVKALGRLSESVRTEYLELAPPVVPPDAVCPDVNFRLDLVASERLPVSDARQRRQPLYRLLLRVTVYDRRRDTSPVDWPEIAVFPGRVTDSGNPLLTVAVSREATGLQGDSVVGWAEVTLPATMNGRRYMIRLQPAGDGGHGLKDAISADNAVVLVSEPPASAEVLLSGSNPDEIHELINMVHAAESLLPGTSLRTTVVDRKELTGDGRQFLLTTVNTKNSALSPANTGHSHFLEVPILRTIDEAAGSGQETIINSAAANFSAPQIAPPREDASPRWLTELADAGWDEARLLSVPSDKRTPDAFEDPTMNRRGIVLQVTREPSAPSEVHNQINPQRPLDPAARAGDVAVADAENATLSGGLSLIVAEWLRNGLYRLQATSRVLPDAIRRDVHQSVDADVFAAPLAESRPDYQRAARWATNRLRVTSLSPSAIPSPRVLDEKKSDVALALRLLLAAAIVTTVAADRLLPDSHEP